MGQHAGTISIATRPQKETRIQHTMTVTSRWNVGVEVFRRTPA